MDVNEEFCENSKKNWGVLEVRLGGGVWVDVNEELKFL